jgi:hypothetical protein
MDWKITADWLAIVFLLAMHDTCIWSGLSGRLGQFVCLVCLVDAVGSSVWFGSSIWLLRSEECRNEIDQIDKTDCTKAGNSSTRSAWLDCRWRPGRNSTL